MVIYSGFFPLNMVIFHSELLVYQRLSTVKLLWWSGFPFIRETKTSQAELNETRSSTGTQAGTRQLVEMDGDGYCPEMAVCQNLVPL